MDPAPCGLVQICKASYIDSIESPHIDPPKLTRSMTREVADELHQYPFFSSFQRAMEQRITLHCFCDRNIFHLC